MFSAVHVISKDSKNQNVILVHELDKKEESVLSSLLPKIFRARERREQESSQGHYWVQLHLMTKGISREKAHEENMERSDLFPQ